MPKAITYASAGVSRGAREKSRLEVTSLLHNLSAAYGAGSPRILPFGVIFPEDKSLSRFIDFQIEGVGTKTLIAEHAGKYDTIGIDAVAMAVNDVIRSGAKPVLLSDALHISRSNLGTIRAILRGVMHAARVSGCTLASGETGDVADILHRPIDPDETPFDLFVSALGIVEKEKIVRGQVSSGDLVIGLESSGIHSNGLSLARRLLLKRWGGLYDIDDSPGELGGKRTVGEELLEPTRIYVAPIIDVQRKYTIKAAIHITGDGFSKFGRLLSFQ